VRCGGLAFEPFLDSIVESITLIKDEVYVNGAGARRDKRAAASRGPRPSG
jgi:hypothetical protein